MANLGERDSNSSQFYITSKACQWLDGHHVVFGEVVKGQEVVEKIQEFGTRTADIKDRVVISDCGELNKSTAVKEEDAGVEEKFTKLHEKFK